MKKMYRISLFYIILGLIAGVVNHELASRTHFIGESAMAVVHPHAILLGGVVFLLMPLFLKNFPLEQQKSFRLFLWVYNIGLLMTLGFMAVRGISQLLSISLSPALHHMVSGFAGIGHILLTAGLIFLFRALMRSAEERSTQ